MTGKQRGYAFDVDAWIQFHLLRLASHHAETTKADIAVLAEIIQRYWGKYGNGWVTHEHLGATAGISKATVIRAKRNLERLGFVTVIQAGRRGSATVYKPNFALVPQKGVIDDTETKGSTDDTETSGLGSTNDTITTEYGITDATPSYLPDRPTRAESQIDRTECAAPGAPHPDGLGATGAGSAQGGFEELWKAYDYRQRKSDGRAAYEKLSPDAELHARIVEAASAWRAAWAAQGKADAPRFTLAKWLEREEFECDPPTTYKPKKRKASKPEPEPEPSAANDNEPSSEDDLPEFMRGSPSLWPAGEYYGEFIENNVATEFGGKDLAADLIFQVNTPGEHFGRQLRHKFYVQSFVQSAQEEGQSYLASIARALGIGSVEDLDELMFKPLRVKANGRTLVYSKMKEAA